MADFEGLVRPFQLPNSAPPRQYVTAKQQSTPTVKLMFGRSGSGRTFNGSYSGKVSRYSPYVASEDKRVYKNPKFDIDWPDFSTPDFPYFGK